MGLVSTPSLHGSSPFDLRTAPEVTMLSEGLMIRTGAAPDELCRIEDLGIGDAVWDVSTQRLVDIETMACATLGALHLAEMGLRPTKIDTATGTGWFALSSSRLIDRDSTPTVLMQTPCVFFRLWPETRLLAEVQGRPVLLRAY